MYNTYSDVDDIRQRITDIDIDIQDIIDEEGEDADVEDLRNEMDHLIESAEDIANSSGDGEQAHLILEDEFTEYAKQFAEDIGVVSEADGWPCTHIDWDAAADELRMDYIEIDIEGVSYLYR